MKKVATLFMLLLFLLFPMIQAQVGNIGEVVVSSSPGGATVFIDGEEKGMTSTGSTAPLRTSVIAGVQHTLTLKKDGYQDKTTTFKVEPGDTKNIELKLNPVTSYGQVMVNSVPGGASVTFDGEYVGPTSTGSTAPLVISSVEPNVKHKLLVQKSGYNDYSTSFSIKPGETKNVDVKLKVTPETGQISISSSPSGASIILDGSHTGMVTPSLIKHISASEHHIKLNKPGYSTWSTTIQITSDHTSHINADLNRLEETGKMRVDSEPDAADIYLNNLFYDETPAHIGNLDEGHYVVRIHRVGYYDWVKDYWVHGGEKTDILAVLDPLPEEPETGDIIVTSTPVGASVYLDDNYKGRTNTHDLDLTEVDPGDYVISFKMKGYEDYTTKVKVDAGETSRVAVVLKSIPSPTTGGISVTSQPSGADVYLDNLYKGVTPIVIPDITEGSHVVNLKLNDHDDATETVQVIKGQTTPFYVVLPSTHHSSVLLGYILIAGLGIIVVSVILYLIKGRGRHK